MNRVNAWMSTVRPTRRIDDLVARHFGHEALGRACSSTWPRSLHLPSARSRHCCALRRAGERQLREPGVLRKRAAHLVEYVRPYEAIVVQTADDVDFAKQRVANGLGAIAIFEERRVARRIANRRDPFAPPTPTRARSVGCTGLRPHQCRPRRRSTEPMRNLSRNLPEAPAAIAPKSTLLRRVAFFLPALGRRLISIMRLASMPIRLAT